MQSSNNYKNLKGINRIKNKIENYDNLSMNNNNSYFNLIQKQKLLKNANLELNAYNINTRLSINNNKTQKILFNTKWAKNYNNNTTRGKMNINFIKNNNNFYIL